MRCFGRSLTVRHVVAAISWHRRKCLFLVCIVAVPPTVRPTIHHAKEQHRAGPGAVVRFKKIYLYRGVTGAGKRPPSSNKKFCFCTWTGGASPVQPVHGSPAGRLQGERRPINFLLLLFSCGKVANHAGVVRNVTNCQMFQLGVTIFKNHLTLCQIKCILYNVRGNSAT